MEMTRGKVISSSSMPLALIGILSILVLPIPTALLDIFLALNITISLIILFSSLFMERVLQFSSFPAVLLVTTLFRLAMNVASTRLILLHGNEGLDAAGSIIQAFGEFVVGGNYVVGAVIFIVISIVNIKVITKGATRIAEVAARFTLDAMPGKQMAIDSDLNSGLIGEAEARQRRHELQQESEFYGSMDGAAKFVSGDAIAGLFITGINIAGGFFIGIVMQDMDWMAAAEVYTLLTIGDGLVSQIPSIIISTSAGLIVARAASSGEDLGTEVLGQLGTSQAPLWISSGVCIAMAFVPGLPFVPFMVLGLASGAAAYYRRTMAGKEKDEAKRKAALGEKSEEQAGPRPGSTEDVTRALQMVTLKLEVGYELVSLVEGGDLVERIRTLRRQFATDYGFIVPAIHITDNVRIKPASYRLLLREQEVGEGLLKTHHLLAMDPGNVSAPIDGVPTREPAFGLDALWIRETDKERAQFAGYTVVDLSTVITTHLTELIRSHMHELLGRQEVQHLVDTLSADAPKVVEELTSHQLTIGHIQQVLVNLLREHVSIRDLRTILETLADWAPTVKHPERLSEYVRRRLARTITASFTTDEGMLPLVNLAPSLERVLADGLQQSDEGSYIAIDPAKAQLFINKVNTAAERFAEHGHTPLILAPNHLRPALFKFVERFAPGYFVISHQEISPQTRVQSLGVITLDETIGR